MLHITSLMQNVAKKNKNRHKPSSLTHLNGLTRNFSFVFDNYSNKCDVNYEPDSEDENETSAKGYWGYLRDQKADKQIRLRSGLNMNRADSKSPEQIQVRNEPDRYCWGLFQDAHLEPSLKKIEFNKKSNKPKSPRTPIMVKNSSSEDSILSSDSDKYSPSQFSPTEKVESPEMPKKIVYDYKRSKFKIEAQKRDEMKIFIQNLEDQEATFRKTVIKSFDSIPEPDSSSSNLAFTHDLISIVRNHSNLLSTAKSNTANSSKTLSFLLYSNKSSSDSSFNYNSFRRVFTTVSKLNKSINMLIGKNDSNNNHDISSAFFHTTVNDLTDLIDQCQTIKSRSPTTASKNNSVSLCSNLFEKLVSPKSSLTANLKPYGLHNHSTMLIEHQGVKIGFMALFDHEFFLKLAANVPEHLASKLEYLDYVQEADRLSKQLRLNGANLIVAIANMMNEQESESRLVSEASDLDIILSPSALNSEMTKYSMLKENKWFVKGSSQKNILSLIKLKLTQTSFSQKYVLSDLAINEYHLE